MLLSQYSTTYYTTYYSIIVLLMHNIFRDSSKTTYINQQDLRQFSTILVCFFKCVPCVWPSGYLPNAHSQPTSSSNKEFMGVSVGTDIPMITELGMKATKINQKNLTQSMDNSIQARSQGGGKRGHGHPVKVLSPLTWTISIIVYLRALVTFFCDL